MDVSYRNFLISLQRLLMKKFLIKIMVGLGMNVCFVYSGSSCQPLLIIIRHGHSTHNEKGCFNSDPSHPDYEVSHLMQIGKNQINATTMQLLQAGIKNDTVERVYVSPLPRTCETANILIDNGIVSSEKIFIDERLTEAKAGDHEGQLSLGFFDNDLGNAHDYGGETNEDVSQRVQPFYNEIKSNTSNKYIIVVTHGTPAFELIKMIMGTGEKLTTGGYKIIDIGH